jgi:DNA-directed RNA polymerase specialized sigma24 family protein
MSTTIVEPRRLSSIHNHCTGNILDAATLRLVKQIARRLSHRLRFAHIDCEDIQQELILDLMERCEKFNPSKARSRTFFTRILCHKAAGILRFELRKKRRPSNGHCLPQDYVTPCVSNTDEEDMESRDCQGLDDVPCSYQEIDLPLDIQTVIDNLPEPLCSICKQLESGSIADVCRELGLSKHAWWKLLRELRQHFVEAGVHGYV